MILALGVFGAVMGGGKETKREKVTQDSVNKSGGSKSGGKGSFDTSMMFANENLKYEDVAETKVIAEEMYFQF